MVQGSKIYTFPQLAGLVQASKTGVKTLANNTTAHFVSNSRIGIRLHNVDVVILGADGTYQLFTGGYTTDTTKDRLNGFSPATIVLKDFAFYVVKEPGKGRGKDNLALFYEGMKVDRLGRVIG
jgi:hypothetical protein